MNLPNVLQDQHVNQYLSYCDSITRGLKRTLFVRSSGAEVIIDYI
jgi:hypothetical protein